MRMSQFLTVMALALIALGSASAGVLPFAPSQAATQAGEGKDAPPADEAPPTRAQILKEGPAALEQHCTYCHQPDKWEGTNRDHDGWAAIVREMSRQMVEARMPPMNDRTANLIVGYLTLTRPQ